MPEFATAVPPVSNVYAAMICETVQLGLACRYGWKSGCAAESQGGGKRLCRTCENDVSKARGQDGTFGLAKLVH